MNIIKHTLGLLATAAIFVAFIAVAAHLKSIQMEHIRADLNNKCVDNDHWLCK